KQKKVKNQIFIKFALLLIFIIGCSDPYVGKWATNKLTGQTGLISEHYTGYWVNEADGKHEWIRVIFPCKNNDEIQSYHNFYNWHLDQCKIHESETDIEIRRIIYNHKYDYKGF